MEKVLRCAIYIRVSSTEQAIHGKSLEAQLSYLTEYAESKNMKVIGCFADEGKTARKELRRRKAIKELLEHVKRDEVDVIIFWKMDRWFRNVSDFYKVQDILDAHKCKWVAVAEPGMNLDTREGRLNVNIMLSINQNETDTTSERIKFVNEASVKQGKAIFGTPSLPIGYKVEVVDGVKRIIKDPDTQDMVNDAFDHYLMHQSKNGTLKYVNQKYGKTYTINVIENMCKNPLYIGKYRENENYCPAYITAEQYAKMQEINKNNIKVYKGRGGNSVYLFSGLLICPKCGRKLSGSSRKRAASDKPYKYYRCANHYINHCCPYSSVVPEDFAESYLLKNVSNLFDRHQSIIVDASAKQKSVDSKPVDVSVYKRELDRLNTMFQKGRISEDKYDSEYIRLSNIISQYTIVSFEDKKIEKSREKIEQVLNTGWEDIYSQLDLGGKRAFWRLVIKQITMQPESRNIDRVYFLS